MSIRTSLKKVLPPISVTEQEALDAGDIWLETSIYQGQPDMAALRQMPLAQLSAEEQAFIDGPVTELIAMIDDYAIQNEVHLPKQIIDFLSTNKFFSIIIPKAFGGLEFSPFANSTIVSKIATKSSAVAVTVMVPNSLGPGELLMHYGTKEQQDYWLPRLAVGQDIPCFALTGPDAGSDAGALPDAGFVTKGMYNGEEVLGMSITWDKRYITLAPIATVLGLAFKAYDPDKLLGGETELGITCALIPKSHPGVELGNRHNPMDQRFYNGTTRGKDVFIPMEFIIGGQAKIGRGWQMLVSCLGAGRGISLPAMGTASAQGALKAAAEYSFVREQFGVPIGRFEGIQEKLGDMAGKTYLLEAMRVLTTEGLGLGLKPSVITAMAKYHMTELGRDVLGQAMDVQAGKAIQKGPQNTLANAYQSQPIAITVEGANILTRCLMIFGQGAMRCHPFLKEMVDLIHSNSKEADGKFNAVLGKTVGYSVKNAFRSLFQSYIPALRKESAKHPAVKPFEKRMNTLSANLATMADMALLVLGGDLKKKEMLSARLGDMMSYLYMTMAAIRYFEMRVDNKIKDQALPYFEYGATWALAQAEKAQAEFVANFPNAPTRILMRVLTNRYTSAVQGVTDRHTIKAAEACIQDNEFRKQMSHLVVSVAGDGFDINTQAFEAKHKVLPLLGKIQKLLRKQPAAPGTLFRDALAVLKERGDITQAEFDAVLDYDVKRAVAVRVDEYDFDLNLLTEEQIRSGQPAFQHKPAA